MTLALLLCALIQDAPGDEGFDPFGWARAIDEADLSWTWGPMDFQFRGELDLDAHFFSDLAPGITLEEAPLRSRHHENGRPAQGHDGVGRLSLILDGFQGEWLEWSVDARVDRGTPADSGEEIGARLEQYWARMTHPDLPELSLQLGKFPAPLGSFIPRSPAKDNPLAAWPLPYDHIVSYVFQANTAAAILGFRDVPDRKHWRVPIWQADYGHGATLSSSYEGFGASFALTNSAPGTWPWDWNVEPGDFSDPNVYLRLTRELSPASKLGLSLSQGPYDKKHGDGIPAGSEAADSVQKLGGLDLSYTKGDLDLFAEAYWIRFESPLVDDLDLWTWYLEGKYVILPGCFASARVAQMFFGKIHDAGGDRHHWDHATTRIEFGGGYSFTRNLLLKASMQFNRQHTGSDPDDDLGTVQIVLTF